MTRILTLLLLAITITACGPVYKTEYRFQTPPTQQGKVCANNCLDKMEACKANCRTSIAECKRIKSLEAENAYLHYVNERRADGKEVEKTKRSFENFSGCNLKCEEGCESVHRICHSNCGGNVVEHRYCTAFCDQ